MVSVNDDIANKLYDHYDLADDATLNDSEVERSGTALLQRYRADNNLDDWEEYVAHVAGASPFNNFIDDQAAFWAAFVP